MAQQGTAVWIDGALVDPEAASVSVFDHGFTVGDGVFETLRTIGGRPFAVRRHLERLRSGADRLGLDVPLSERALRAVVDEVVGAAAAPRPADAHHRHRRGRRPLGRAAATGRPPSS